MPCFLKHIIQNNLSRTTKHLRILLLLFLAVRSEGSTLDLAFPNPTSSSAASFLCKTSSRARIEGLCKTEGYLKSINVPLLLCIQFYKRLFLLIELVQALQLRHDKELQRVTGDLFGLEKDQQAKHRFALRKTLFSVSNVLNLQGLKAFGLV